MSFLPQYLQGSYADTGAGNWRPFYSTWKLEDLAVMSIRDVHASAPSDPFHKDGDFHRFLTESLTLLDERWVHLINGSNWALVESPGKLDHALDFIERFGRGAAEG